MKRRKFQFIFPCYSIKVNDIEHEKERKTRLSVREEKSVGKNRMKSFSCDEMELIELAVIESL
jgi:hypothetical protein